MSDRPDNQTNQTTGRDSISSKYKGLISKIKPGSISGFQLGRTGFFKNKKILIGAGVILLIIGGFIIFGNGSGNSSKIGGSLLSSSAKPLNKKILLPIKTKDGNDTGNNLAVNLTNLERTNRVLYNGRPLIARETKDFIIINIEVENSTKDRLTVRPVDFVRLIGDENKNYAADIQTNPVKVEPLSVKKTRLIFIVNESQSSLRFLVGEVNGEKEAVDITV